MFQRMYKDEEEYQMEHDEMRFFRRDIINMTLQDYSKSPLSFIKYFVRNREFKLYGQEMKAYAQAYNAQM